MKRKYKNIVICIIVIGVFLFKLKDGLVPNAQPFVVVIAAIMASCIALALLEFIFWMYSKTCGLK